MNIDNIIKHKHSAALNCSATVASFGLTHSTNNLLFIKDKFKPIDAIELLEKSHFNERPNSLVNHDIIEPDKKSTANHKPAIKLSFQLMTRAEPVQLVIDTIRSLLAIKSADDEILIIDNNHTDTAQYKPLEHYCQQLDERFNVHFYHVDAVAGYKSGALNLALGLMDPTSTHIVVVDSDYQALPHARHSIVQAIKQYPNCALLQFPQFYRDTGLVDVHSELNHYFNYHLYRPFNCKRALSTGTYAVIQRDALLHLGGWSSASITEDAQMGVLMHRQGLRSQFIPEVIATGLLPTTLPDLIAQRQRWIYGNVQVLNHYFSIANNAHKPPIGLIEQLAYMRAHLSQLSAWINFSAIFIIMHACTLLLIAILAIMSTNMNLQTLLTPLYAVYAAYALFLGRRLWAYLHDKAPLNKQVNSNKSNGIGSRLRSWALHLNFWELGALSWLPVLWGQDRPFICTPKEKHLQSKRALFIANICALPKLILALSFITALIVAPFSPLYSPLLFVLSLTICALKIWSMQVIFTNYKYNSPNEESASDAIDRPAFINKSKYKSFSEINNHLTGSTVKQANKQKMLVADTLKSAKNVAQSLEVKKQKLR